MEGGSGSGFNRIERILIFLFRGVNFLLGVMLLALFVMLFAQVLFRYAFSLPLYWVEETVLYLMVYITMLGCASAYRRYLHPRLVIIYGRFHPPRLFLYELILRLPVLMLMAVFVWYGYRYAAVNEWMRTSSLEISFFWPFFGIPFGAAVTLLALILDSADIIAYRRSWLMNINVPEMDDDI
ncbi:MAG: TRAP transporter small permease [Planctomycetota bacterium]|jgi:TRAP-type C4-dicarboxylate transport system permease small subunit|nr:TRAP transporter small permease [Planctomycetota bacterium]